MDSEQVGFFPCVNGHLTILTEMVTFPLRAQDDLGGQPEKTLPLYHPKNKYRQ